MLGASGRRAFRVAVFGLGLLSGAFATAIVAWILVSLVAPALDIWPPLRAIIVFSGLGLISLRELGILRFWLPENRRLVPETVFRLGDFFGPLQFGIEMGSGFRTYVSSSLPYAFLLLTLCASDFWAVCFGAVGFATGRELMTVLSVASADPGNWDTVFRRDFVARRLAHVVFVAAAIVVVLRFTEVR